MGCGKSHYFIFCTVGASNLEQAALESVQCAFHYCQNKKRIIWQKGSMLLVLWRGFFLSPSWDIFTKQKKAQENPLRKVSVQPFVRGGSATNGNYTFFFSPRKFTNLTSFSLRMQQSLCVCLNGWFASEQACRSIVWNQREVQGGSLITELRCLQRQVRCHTAFWENQPIQLQECLGTFSKNRYSRVRAIRRGKSILCVVLGTLS